MSNSNVTVKNQGMIPHNVFSPYFPETFLLANMPGSGLTSYEYTNWRDETCSWKSTCYIHSGLNPTTTYKLKGSRVIEFLSKVCVTNFTKFPIGMMKHGVMCNESGQII